MLVLYLRTVEYRCLYSRSKTSWCGLTERSGWKERLCFSPNRPSFLPLRPLFSFEEMTLKTTMGESVLDLSA